MMITTYSRILGPPPVYKGRHFGRQQFYYLIRAFLHTQKTEFSMCFAVASSRVYFNYTVGLSSNTRQYRAAKGTASFSNYFIHSFSHCLIHWFTILMSFVLLFGKNPQAVAYSAQPLCWSG